MPVLTAEKIVPISRFNKGEANKVFAEVKKSGTKYVFKNNLPECVLIAPEQYEQMLDNITEMELYIEALKRKAAPDQKLYSEGEALKLLGIAEVNPENGEVDLE